jgi:TonB family protein
MQVSVAEGTMKQLLCLLAILAGMLFIAAPSLAQDAESHPDTGIIYGQQYVNSYFGFSYRFPAGWSGSATRLTMASQVYPLFAASSANAGNGSYIAIQAEPLRQNGNIKTGKDFLAIAAMPSGFETLPGDKHYIFGGKDFDRIDLRSTSPNSVLVRQALVCIVLRDYAITFQFKATNDNELEDLVNTMLSLSFLDSGQPAATAAATTTTAVQAPTQRATTAPMPAPVQPTTSVNTARTDTIAFGTTQTNAAPSAANPQPVKPTTPTATTSSAATGAPSALIKMESPPHTLRGDTLPATTISEAEPQALVKVASKPDATKTAVIQAVMPAPSAELNTTAARNTQASTSVSKTAEPTKTQTAGTTAELTPAAIRPSAPISKATSTAIAGKTTTEITRVQISAATLESYVIRKVPAMYPLAARQGRVEGLVELTIVVDDKGEVQNVKAVSGPPILARSAEEALRHWRFRPIIVDGKATPIESRVSLNFQLSR